MRRITFILHEAKRLAKCRSGNFAVIFALLVPLLLGVAGGAIDLLQYRQMQSRMQAMADAAVLAATREGALKGWDENVAISVAKQFIEDEVRPKISSAGQGGGGGTFLADATMDKKAKQVTVTVSVDHHPFFYVGYFPAPRKLSSNPLRQFPRT